MFVQKQLLLLFMLIRQTFGDLLYSLFGLLCLLKKLPDKHANWTKPSLGSTLFFIFCYFIFYDTWRALQAHVVKLIYLHFYQKKKNCFSRLDLSNQLIFVHYSGRTYRDWQRKCTVSNLLMKDSSEKLNFQSSQSFIDKRAKGKFSFFVAYSRRSAIIENLLTFQLALYDFSEFISATTQKLSVCRYWEKKYEKILVF